MKYIIATIAVLLLVTSGLIATSVVLTEQRTTKHLTVNHQNTSQIALYKSQPEGDDLLIQDGITSGESIPVEVMSDQYFLAYKGSDGYADGLVKIDRFTDSVDIEPVYSTDRLADLYDDERSAILDGLTAKYPNWNDLYNLSGGQLYQFGDWFGAALIYKGDARANYDDVGLIMQKRDSKWVVVTDPPLPSVDIYHDPAIPLDAAQGVNKLLHS